MYDEPIKTGFPDNMYDKSHVYCNYIITYLSVWNIERRWEDEQKTLENTEEVIKYGQSRETGNIR